MKDFFVNFLDVWEELDWLERTGIVVLSLVALVFVVLCIMWPILPLCILMFAFGIGVIVFSIIGLSTILDRI